MACTRDACAADGSCTHTPEHAACPAGTYCDPAGCIDGPVCATDEDCPRPDPCLIVTCSPSRRLCEYNLIDGDADGFPPIVCGGGDCDDSTAAIAPDAPEQCDGADRDCDARIDEDYADGEGASVSSCENGYVCDAASCTCPAPLVECPGRFSGEEDGCADFQTDEDHCGACHQRCPDDATCVAGECVCDSGYSRCGDRCVDLTRDPDHCGACFNGCELDCVAGACACPAGESLCEGSPDDTYCAALDTELSNCGACGVVCMRDSSCAAGACGALTHGAVTYGASRTGAAASSPPRAGFAHARATGVSFLRIPFYGEEVRRYEGNRSTDSFMTASSPTLPPLALQQHVVAVGPDLSHRWQTRASTGDDSALAVDAAGDVYLAGRFDGGAVIGTTTLDAFAGGGVVAKLDGATGALVWSRTMPGGFFTSTRVADVAPLASGDMVAAGTMISAYDFGNGTPLDTTGGEGFVWIFAPDGTYRAAWRVPGGPSFVTSNAAGDVVVAALNTDGVMPGGGTLTAPAYAARDRRALGRVRAHGPAARADGGRRGRGRREQSER